MTEQEQTQFEEYFQINHSIDISLQRGGFLADLPDLTEFEANIPAPFKLASEMKGVEQNMLRPLRQLGDVIEPLADYLKAQSRKIDLMMSYILQTQEENSVKFKTESYGGGGFVFRSSEKLAEDAYYICKMYFHDDAAAMYCHVKVIQSEELQDPETKYQHTMIFNQIRDDDREMVVRASLHQQSKQLLQKTSERQAKSK